MEEKLQKRLKNWFRITSCLALGGIGMLLIMCLFIGFGLNSLVGKQAIYTCLALQMCNGIVIFLGERAMKKYIPAVSKRMRVFRTTFKWLWRAGVLLLLVSLLLILIGQSMGSFWVKTTCYIGLPALFVGWIGESSSFHRMQQSVIAQLSQKSLI